MLCRHIIKGLLKSVLLLWKTAQQIYGFQHICNVTRVALKKTNTAYFFSFAVLLSRWQVLTPKHGFHSHSELRSSKCAGEIDENKTLLLYSFWMWYWFMIISFYASWGEVVKNLPDFPPCALSMLMLKFLVFQADMSNVVWTVWLWQSNGTCLREIPIFILKWTRNGLDWFFKGLAILTYLFLFFALIQLPKAGGQKRGRRSRAVREERNELSNQKGWFFFYNRKKKPKQPKNVNPTSA